MDGCHDRTKGAHTLLQNVPNIDWTIKLKKENHTNISAYHCGDKRDKIKSNLVIRVFSRLQRCWRMCAIILILCL